MKLSIHSLLLLTILLGACASNPSPTQSESTQLESNTAEPAAQPNPTESIQATTAPNADRNAVIAETEGDVLVRAVSESEFEPASNGFVIQQSGGLQTGSDGRVRLDLMPEKTIVRIAPNSAFVLNEVSQNEEGAPKSSLALFFGKIFILLNGGSLEVETPSGVASVKGSVMSVSYNPETDQFQASCLEGHCTLENEDGQEVDIPEGESGYIDDSGEINQFDGIDQGEITEWVEEVPEIEEFLGEAPDPNEYEDLEGYEEYNFDPYTYFEGSAGEDGGEFWFLSDDNYQGWDWSSPEAGGEDAPTEGVTEEAPTESVTEEAPVIESPTEDPNSGGGSGEAPTEDPASGGGEAPTEVPTP